MLVRWWVDFSAAGAVFFWAEGPGGEVWPQNLIFVDI